MNPFLTIVCNQSHADFAHPYTLHHAGVLLLLDSIHELLFLRLLLFYRSCIQVPTKAS